LRVVRRISWVLRTFSSSERRSLTPDFEIPKRRAAPAMEPVSTTETKEATDSSLSIVRVYRKLGSRIMAVGVFTRKTTLDALEN
jgi:hypothetical protein